MRKLQNARKAYERKFDVLVFCVLDRFSRDAAKVGDIAYIRYVQPGILSCGLARHQRQRCQPESPKTSVRRLRRTAVFQFSAALDAEPSREARTRKGLVAGGREDWLPEMTSSLNRVVIPCQKSQDELRHTVPRFGVQIFRSMRLVVLCSENSQLL
jgi:hypothetical protein